MSSAPCCPPCNPLPERTLMMKLPESLPLQLMLMMLQSQGSPAGSMPWNAGLTNLHGLFPWLPKPKSPLEQSLDAAQNLWNSASDPWQQAGEAMLKSLQPNPRPPNAANNRRQQSQNRASADSPSLADFFDTGFLSALSREM